MAAFVSGLIKGGVDEASQMGDDGGKKKKKKRVKKIDVPAGESVGAPFSFKRGGKVKRTGMAKVHKGERVLTKKQQKGYRGKKR